MHSAKKVAILTFFFACNHGAVLQAYALQRLLDDLGYDSKIVRYIPRWGSSKGVLSSCTGKSAIRKAASIAVRMPANMIRRRVFDRFLEGYLRCTERQYENVQQLGDNLPEADVFLAGSDQVWNSAITGGIDGVYYLNFVPPDKKKVAYAASIGTDDFEADEKPEIKRLLEQFDAISVREKSAQAAISNLGISDVKHVLDPTLAVPSDTWTSLMSKRRVRDSYLLFYCLEEGKRGRMLSIAEAMAREWNLRLVKIVAKGGRDSLVAPRIDRNYWFCTPSDFVSYFRYANYVLTDSFHGLCFSLAFKKQFSVVLPEQRATRLDSLLCQFGLRDRVVVASDNLESQRDPIDYGLVNEVLERSRQESVDFLAEALRL